MMSTSSKSDDQILDAVDYGAHRLPHPIDLLSADLMADVSGVPKTTLLSAASSLDSVRTDVLTAAISRLGVVPGEATWTAMRAGLADPSIGEGLASIMAARADELAEDPAFPYFLSGFDRLTAVGVADAVALACSEIVAELVPFVDTLLLAESDGRAVKTHLARMTLLATVLSMALERLIAGGANAFSNGEVSRRVAVKACRMLRVDTRSPDVNEPNVDPYVPAPIARRLPEGSLGRAVEAAAEVMLSGGVPLRFGVRLDDVLQAGGLSSATFYRRFGSMAGFERLLIERTGLELVRGFRDGFFSDVLASIGDGSITADEAVGELQRRAVEQMALHVETKRPGTEVLPWMATEVGTQVFAPAFQQLNEEWGAFFSGFADELGAPLRDGIAGSEVAAALHATSWIGELLVRNAPNRELASALVRERSGLVQQIVFGLS